MARSQAWSAEEIQRLRVDFSRLSWAELMQTFRRTKPALEQKAAQLGLHRSYQRRDASGDHRANGWSEEHLRIMREQYAGTPSREIAALVDRSYDAVMKKAQTLGLQRHRRGMATMARSWSPEDNELLRQEYRTASIAELAARLAISEQAVRQRAFYLGLSRPTNQGRHLPLGSERINHGVKERKVVVAGGRRRAWKRVEVIDWEAENGPVPHGYVLVCLRGAERRADNLTLMRIEDHPVSAYTSSAPAAVLHLNQLKAQFTRQLNKLEKENGNLSDEASNARAAWTPAEDAYLRANVRTMRRVALADALLRSPKAVNARARKLGLSGAKNRAWTVSEVMLLKTMYASTRHKVLASRLGRTNASIERKAMKLGLVRTRV